MTTREEIEELINAQIKLVSSDDFLNPLVEQRFDEFDQDKSGYLDKEEFWDYLQELRDDMEADNVNIYGLKDITKELAEGRFDLYDTNKDGKLSKEELKEFIRLYFLDLIKLASEELKGKLGY